MKFKVEASKIPNYEFWARRAGYALIYDRRSGRHSFVRRLGSGHYPRLHLYIEPRGSFLQFSLHLDQKKASYQGHARHSAEDDHYLVQEEFNRLKSLIDFNDLI